jgi:spermidine/putrescine transport system permease protein
VRKRSLGLAAYSVIALVFLLVPIVYTIAFSFNDSKASNTLWEGFTLRHWANVCSAGNICEALGNSIFIGVVSTLIATVLGTALAIAIARYSFKYGNPRGCLGCRLAAFFFNAGFTSGFVTTIIAHVMFCLSFVVVTVKARVQTLDPVLEEAGRDLYANPNQVFWKITFPLLVPGIVSAALLSFALSFDDFIITYFNSGSVPTFPKFIYVAALRAVPAEANVIASAVFLLAIVAVLTTQIVGAVRRRRLA